MNASPKTTGSSATVRSQLLIADHAFEVAQLGPGYVILRNPLATAPAEAVLSLIIDGEEELHHVWLPNGIRQDDVRTTVQTSALRQSIAG